MQEYKKQNLKDDEKQAQIEAINDIVKEIDELDEGLKDFSIEESLMVMT